MADLSDAAKTAIQELSRQEMKSLAQTAYDVVTAALRTNGIELIDAKELLALRQRLDAAEQARDLLKGEIVRVYAVPAIQEMVQRADKAEQALATLTQSHDALLAKVRALPNPVSMSLVSTSRDEGYTRYYCAWCQFKWYEQWVNGIALESLHPDNGCLAADPARAARPATPTE